MTRGFVSLDEVRQAVGALSSAATAEEFKTIIALLAMAIQDAKEIPSGHLYASVMSRISLDLYLKIEDVLISAYRLKKENHVLYWTPESDAKMLESR